MTLLRRTRLLLSVLVGCHGNYSTVKEVSVCPLVIAEGERVLDEDTYRFMIVSVVVEGGRRFCEAGKLGSHLYLPLKAR